MNDTDTDIDPETVTPLEWLVRASFLIPGNSERSFATCSGPFLSRGIAEEAALRMLFDPRVICAEIIPA